MSPLHPAIEARIAQSERDGGLYLKDIKPGDTAEVQTLNTLYTIKRLDDDYFEIQGSPKYCPSPTKVSIPGSTWGGSMLKLGFIGIGMHLEFVIPNETEPDRLKVVTTSPIQSVCLKTAEAAA